MSRWKTEKSLFVVIWRSRRFHNLVLAVVLISPNLTFVNWQIISLFHAFRIQSHLVANSSTTERFEPLLCKSESSGGKIQIRLKIPNSWTSLPQFHWGKRLAPGLKREGGQAAGSGHGGSDQIDEDYRHHRRPFANLSRDQLSRTRVLGCQCRSYIFCYLQNLPQKTSFHLKEEEVVCSYAD